MEGDGRPSRFTESAALRAQSGSIAKRRGWLGSNSHINLPLHRGPWKQHCGRPSLLSYAISLWLNKILNSHSPAFCAADEYSLSCNDSQYHPVHLRSRLGHLRNLLVALYDLCRCFAESTGAVQPQNITSAMRESIAGIVTPGWVPLNH